MTSIIQDWVVEIDVNTTKAEKQIRDFEKRLKKIQDLMNFPTSPTRPTGPRQPRSPRPQQGFQLADDRQLKLANTLDSVVRRAGRGLGETSEEFKKINTQANVLKERIKGIGSKTDLEKLNNEIRILRERTTQATSAIRQQNAAMTKQKFVAKGVTDSLRNMTRSYVSVFAAIEGGRSALNVGRDFENLNATLLLSSGSAEQAKSDFGFLVNMSRQLGLSLRDTSRAFSKFAVAANSADLSVDETRQTFTQLSSSIRATGLTQDRANLAFLAFQQMLAGPVIQAQEMNQIIEQMPQFTGIAKKALAEMGMEVENYREAVATGTVDSREFVTTVARMMDTQARQTGAYGKAINSLSAAQSRFRTEMELAVEGFFSAGGRGGIVFFLNQASELTKALAPLLRNLGRTFGFLAKAVGGAIRVFGIFARLSNSVMEIISDLSFGLFKAKSTFQLLGGETGKYFQLLKKQVGLLLTPLGILERFLNTLERLRAGGELDFSSIASTAESLTKVFGETQASLNATKAARIAQVSGTQNGKVNSDNSINVTIEGVDTNNTDSVRDVVNTTLQDFMKVSI